MTNRTGCIAIIPARGGSQRIPRKNVKLFAGQPMISYAIKLAIESQLFDHVVVSTDDDKIADVARRYGAEAPFVRPRELADNDTATVPVIVHAIANCINLGMEFDAVCCIYPCVPLLQVNDLVESFQLFTSSNAQFCFPVVEFPSPIQRALMMNAQGIVAPFFPQNELSRTQDLEITYHDAGQFYWGSSASWISNSSIHNNAIGYEMPAYRVVDIDSVNDWVRAEFLLELQNRKGAKEN